jgi:hypothetical protein
MPASLQWVSAQLDAEVRAGVRRLNVRTQEELARRQANIDAIDELAAWSAEGDHLPEWVARVRVYGVTLVPPFARH